MASGTVITRAGFLARLPGGRGRDRGRGAGGRARPPRRRRRRPAAGAETRTSGFRSSRQGQLVDCTGLEAEGHETRPPARYTEASLVRRLEELGVGRPSTYASIIQTIQDRGYVWRKGTALVPSFTAFAVVGLMERYFANLVDYGFTASMEDDLDEIASGAEEQIPWLEHFYFGESRHLRRPPDGRFGRRPATPSPSRAAGA